MRANRERLGLAIITSIILHIVLIGLFVISSWFTKIQMPSAGGNGGDSDTLDAVMVDTAQVSAEYGNLLKEKQEKSRHSTSQVEKISHEETKPEPEVLQPNLSERSQQQIIEQHIQQQKLVEQQRQAQEKLKILQRQREQAKKQEEETRKKAAEVARLKAEAEAKRLEAAAKQAEEDRKVKELAKKIEEQKKLEAKQLAEARAKAEREEKLKKEEQVNAEKEAQLKAEKEAKLKAEREAKLKAEKEAKAKAVAQAKAKAEAEAKIAQAKKNKTLDDFLNGGDLSSKGGNVNSAGSTGSGGKSGAGQGANVDGNAYQQRIKRLIQSKYRIDPSFSGKQCDVKIFLSKDGTITNYQVLRGDRRVCDAAVSAIVATRKVPPAPSDSVYNQYKSPVLDFSLKVK